MEAGKIRDNNIRNNRNKHTYEESFTRGSVKVVECLTCGYKHLWPIPSRSMLEKFYKEKYFKSVYKDYSRKQTDDREFLNFTYQDKPDILCKLVGTNADKKMLEIGCGSGMFLQFCYENRGKCVGIEPSESLDRTNMKVEVRIYCEFIEKLEPSKIGKFNAVVLSGVLEHIPNPRWICK